MSSALTRPNLIVRGVMVLALALAVFVIVSVLGGGNSYVLRLELANASGLRPGSQVLLGGVPVGTVDSLNLNRRNVVIAELHINRSQVHIGAGVHASIVSANLLGEEYVALAPGNASQPVPSGYTLPESATTPQTDLDQVINVLDGSTRARLAILLQEAGTAVAGRKSDVGAILRQFPLSLSAATQLLTTMVQDNHTLADLVSNSNGFISRINAQSGDLKRVIDSSAGAVTTLALRAGELKQAVIGAPKTLQVLHDFFAGGASSAGSLVKAAGLIADSAPAVNELLTAVKPFTAAAVPTLNRAAQVSPTLTKLAVQATPTVKQAVPTLASLENIATLAKPLSAWLGLSSQDLIGILQGWPRAIQFRDGISHVFHGDLYLNPQIVLGVANQGATPAQRRQNLLDVKNPALLRVMGLLGAANAARRELAAGAGSVLSKVTTILTPRTAPAAPAPPTAQPNPTTQPSRPTSGTSAGSGTSSLGAGLAGLLGGLLGGGHGNSHAGSGSGSGSGSSSGSGSGSGSGSAGGSGSGGGSTPAPPSSLQGLLSYLLGK